MITGVYLVLFLTEPLLTNSEYNNNIYLVLEYPKAVSPEVVFFVTLQMVLNLGFFDFMMVWKQYAFSRNQTSNFGFWSSAGLVICSTVLSGEAGQWATVRLLITINILQCTVFPLFFGFCVLGSYVYKTLICVSCFCWEEEGYYLWGGNSR